MKKKIVVDQDKIKKLIEDRYPLVERPESMNDLEEAYINSQTSIILEEYYFYTLYEYIIQLEKHYKKMRKDLIRRDLESLTVKEPNSAAGRKNTQNKEV